MYGVGRDSIELGPGPGAGGSPLFRVVEGGLAGVVSKVPDAWSPKRDDVWAHARVLEEIARTEDILPMRLGVVVADPETVRELLRANHPALHSALDEVAGMVEIRVKVDYRQDVILREILDGDHTVARLRRQASGTYPERVRLGEAVAEALARLRQRDGAWAARRLDPLSARSWDHPVTGEYMMLDRSFLVRRADINRFDAALSVLEERPVDIRALGPMPPYSFVDPTPLRVAG